MKMCVSVDGRQHCGEVEVRRANRVDSRHLRSRHVEFAIITIKKDHQKSRAVVVVVDCAAERQQNQKP